jgi:hypothetical protein
VYEFHPPGIIITAGERERVQKRMLIRVCVSSYGDITPLSIPGKFLVMIMVIISLAFVG